MSCDFYTWSNKLIKSILKSRLQSGKRQSNIYSKSNLYFPAIDDRSTEFSFSVSGVIRRHHGNETEPFRATLVEDYLCLTDRTKRLTKFYIWKYIRMGPNLLEECNIYFMLDASRALKSSDSVKTRFYIEGNEISQITQRVVLWLQSDWFLEMYLRYKIQFTGSIEVVIAY